MTVYLKGINGKADTVKRDVKKVNVLKDGRVELFYYGKDTYYQIVRSICRDVVIKSIEV